MKDKSRRFTREELSWILYDVANSAFVLVMVTAVMPMFFRDVVATELPNSLSTAYWGYANSTAALILAILSPFLGALADYQNRKKQFFLLFLFIGLLFTFSLPLVSTSQWLLCLVLFICARVGWAGANLFYDAFIVDVTRPERTDKISTQGYGFGYIGSVIPFLIIIALILYGRGDSDALPVFETKVGFIIVAVWWLLFSIPFILTGKQVHYQPPPESLVFDTLRKLKNTLGNIRQYRQAFLFLLAYFFYIDGVGTVISMSTLYGRDLGFSATLLIIVLLFIQVVAFPFALLYGRLAGRFGTKNMLLVGIAVYCIVTFTAFLMPDVSNQQLKTALFWVIAFLVASSMGGIQALSRSYFSTLIPAEKSAEFFGFYNVFGKFAAIGGPFIMGFVTSVTGQSRWGILSIIILFFIGAFLLTKVEKSEVSSPAGSKPVS